MLNEKMRAVIGLWLYKWDRFFGKIDIVIVYATIWEKPFPVITFLKSFGVSKKKKRRRNLLAYVNSHITF